MTILNKDNFPYIKTEVFSNYSAQSFIEYRSDTFAWRLRNFNDENDYWYCEIFQGNAFHVYDIKTLVDSAILTKIRTDNKTFLYIHNSHEAFLDIVEPLYNSLVMNENIPANKIILSNETYDLAAAVKSYADSHSLDYMQVEWINIFEASTGQFIYKTHLENMLVLNEEKIFKKRFLNFNRRWRLHRPTFVALLVAHDLLNCVYVSLGDSDDNKTWNEMLPFIKNWNKHPKIQKMLDVYQNSIMRLPKLYLDFEDLKTNRPEIYDESILFYQNSLISLVSETTFYSEYGGNNARFLSEKTFKPIALGHPFILISVPNSLAIVKMLGYKTFHPYIDESYDQEMDDGERLLKIIKEVKRISKFNDNEVKQFIKDISSIVKYNKTVLLGKIKDLEENNKSSFLRKILVTKR